ncbi:LysR family transcriptional regulator [Neisseria animalis]|uniref:LysR family transcriptional regulator n=2 Tax=Neisseria animalis TaxID=492 RepID=A0A5P3MNG4_NEIAN|nr:LysR family transcriptional regulator [Neisseria animalis]ROW32520.1 LysR family transcriptional regulator [Neisseria animalis]
MPFNALKFFYHAAHTGSITEAARILHVTHGAVSKQIKLLEQFTGVSLFVKQGRGLRLSAQGVELMGCCRHIFEELDNTLRRIAPQEKRDLVVSCEPILAMKWLIPRIGAFQQAHGFNVVILAAGGMVDFARQSIDAALRRNDFMWPSEIFAEAVAAEKTGVVHIPALTQYKKLHTHTRPLAWRDWQNQTGISFEAEGELFFEHFYLCIQAAIAGMGAAVVSEKMVEDEINKGIFIAPHGFCADGSHYYLLSDKPFAADTRKQLFLEWVRQEMA